VIGACAPIHPASVHAARSDYTGPGGLAFLLLRLLILSALDGPLALGGMIPLFDI
jgi:hypothetical protein